MYKLIFNKLLFLLKNNFFIEAAVWFNLVNYKFSLAWGVTLGIKYLLGKLLPCLFSVFVDSVIFVNLLFFFENMSLISRYFCVHSFNFMYLILPMHVGLCFWNSYKKLNWTIVTYARMMYFMNKLIVFIRI